MTEEEAKTKWCPQVRVFETADGEQWNNRPDAGFSSDARCIGSACMAWRWLPISLRYEGKNVVVQYPAPPPTDGFCGLAGKP